MKPYASIFHVYTSKLRPEISLFELKYLDELSHTARPPRGTAQGLRHEAGALYMIIVMIVICIIMIIIIIIVVIIIINIIIMIIIIIIINRIPPTSQ